MSDIDIAYLTGIGQGITMGVTLTCLAFVIGFLFGG